MICTSYPSAFTTISTPSMSRPRASAGLATATGGESTSTTSNMALRWLSNPLNAAAGLLSRKLVVRVPATSTFSFSWSVSLRKALIWLVRNGCLRNVPNLPRTCGSIPVPSEYAMCRLA